MSTGDRVVLETGQAGQIIGWKGALAIVALDSGRDVIVMVKALRRVR